jgi:hypothetical protein
MNKLKLDKEIEINISNFIVDPFGRLIQPFPAQIGFGKFQGDTPNLLKIKELTVVSIIDCPSTKTVYLTLLETAVPLIVWSGKYYEEAGEWTEEQVYKAAADILNNSNGDFLIQLIDRSKFGQYMSFVTEKIKSENSDGLPIRDLMQLLPTPKIPMFPDLAQKHVSAQNHSA